MQKSTLEMAVQRTTKELERMKEPVVSIFRKCMKELFLDRAIKKKFILCLLFYSLNTGTIAGRTEFEPCGGTPGAGTAKRRDEEY